MEKQNMELKPISFHEFKSFSRLFKYIQTDENVLHPKSKKSIMEIEYTAYRGFFEVALPEHLKEFYEMGCITIGDWVLYADLSLGPNDKKEKMRETRLDCTDGGSFGLPYFDRLIQKYLYLRENPEQIINIGTRHGVIHDSHRHPLYPRDHILNVTYDFEELKKRKEFIVRRGETMKITNMPFWTLPIFRLIHHQYNFTRCGGGIIKIKRKRKKKLDRLYDTDSAFGDPDGHFLDMFNFSNHKRVRSFAHYYADKIYNLLEKANFSITAQQKKAISKAIEHSDEIFFGKGLDYKGPVVRDNFIERAMIKTLTKPENKDIIRLPYGVKFAMDTAVYDVRIETFKIIEYYEKHPRYRYTFLKKNGGKKK